MSLVQQHEQGITWLILNRAEKHSAFNEHLIASLTHAIQQAIERPETRVIVLKAEGQTFSAGADLDWMARMAKASYDDNKQDAQKLAELLHTLYHCPKPTIAQIQGPAYGGALGLIAACDLAISASHATFCFSEVKLGLIPATISPFIVEAIGIKAAKWLFMSASVFDAAQAQSLQLIQNHVPLESLHQHILKAAQHFCTPPPLALTSCKTLVHNVAHRPIDASLQQATAAWIAECREAPEAQTLIQQFLHKNKK